VPPHHSFRRDDDEGLLPTRPDSSSNYPEEFIEEAEDRPWTAPLQHGELLPEREILQQEMPTTAKRAHKRSEPEKEKIEHGPELHQINDGKYCCKLLILQSARILANHNQEIVQEHARKGLYRSRIRQIWTRRTSTKTIAHSLD
jgi:hypothetical protein